MMSMVGLTLGVMVLIIVLSVMNGFDRELRERILGVVPHAAIEKVEPLDDWRTLAAQVANSPHVVAVAPFVRAQGLLAHRGVNQPVMVTGIDPVEEPKVSIIPDHMVLGNLDSLRPGEFNIILGETLARNLQLIEGDQVTFFLPEASLTPAGVFPRMKRFTVSGIFSVGAEVDGNFAFVHHQDAARMLRMQGVQGVRLKMDDLFVSRQVVYGIAARLGAGYMVSDWSMTHGNLFQAVRMEKTMVGLLLFLIIAVAAFNIISSQVMVVNDKTPDIAILRTLGATRGQIMRIFIVQGSVVGVVGTCLGTLLGILGALNVSAIIEKIQQLMGIRFLNPDVYFISFLPSELRLSDVVLVVGLSFFLSFGATLYPAWRAARIDPAKALRYE
jgi:lipoprotein-releasing system permease protein